MPPLKDLRLQRFGRLVVFAQGEHSQSSRPRPRWYAVCDCGTVVLVLASSLRSGNTKSCGCSKRELKDVITYYGAHARVARLRGKASDFKCVDCGDSADQWSFDNNIEAEDSCFSQKAGTWYSLNPDRYSPRCRSCHNKFDGKQQKEDE